MSINLQELAVVLTAAILALLALIKLLGHMRKGAARKDRRGLPPARAVFLFQDRALVDATPDAMALIAHQSPHLTEYDAMLAALAESFPDLASTLQGMETGSLRLVSRDHAALMLDLEKSPQSVRLSLICDHPRSEDDPLHFLQQDLHRAELERLRDIADHTTQMVWETDTAGKVIWANPGYIAFAQSPASGASPKDQGATALQRLSDALCQQESRQKRTAIKSLSGTEDHWFDVTSIQRAGGTLHFAADANAVMRADEARRDFVKTLGKTFAQLSTGLAIFDNERRLAMFNPALLDLTGLPVDFLSGRPPIDTVLDHLREQRMIPEPRDYVSWRDQFAAVENAAKAGTYSANWDLPDGQTLRVSGKPHPDGAFAFLFEDITAEVSLARRFRSDIETGQAVLDALPDAIAVFSRPGTLMISNKAYARLWGTKADPMLDHRELEGEMAIWQAQAQPSAIWDNMMAEIARSDTRSPWRDDVMLTDGRNLRCHTMPITGGMTLVRFSVAPTRGHQMHRIGPPLPPARLHKG